MSHAEALTITDEESGDHLEGGRIVEHYRANVWRPLLGYLTVACLIMAIGSISMAGAFFFAKYEPYVRVTDAVMIGPAVDAAGNPLTDDALPYELGLGLFGFACIVGASLTAIMGLRSVMSEEHYLALRTDGAYYRRGNERSLMRWEHVEEVRHEGDGVVLITHDGERWTRAERYAGIDAAALTKRTAAIRRKALFGLL